MDRSSSPQSPAASAGSPPGGKSRMHFQAADDVLLLRELVALEHPFVRASPCWDEIADRLQQAFPDKFARVTARTRRERAQNLMDVYVKEDNRQRKQSGVETDFKEKEGLLESLREKFAEREMSKQAAASARKKEKGDKAKGQQMRADALLVMKEKRKATGDEYHPAKKAKTDVAEMWQQKLDVKAAELQLREKELALRDRQLSLEESRAEQAKKSAEQLSAQAQDNQNALTGMMSLMQQQMQQMTQLMGNFSKKKEWTACCLSV